MSLVSVLSGQKSTEPVKEVKPKKVTPNMETPLAESLSEALDNFMNEGITGRDKKRNGFVPSETNQCARYLVYLLRGIYVPSNHDARTQRIFDNGHDFHERISKYFEDMGILEGTEIPVNSPISVPVPIYGFADGVIDWNGRRVVEFKSINEYGFMVVQKMRKPKDDHFRQLQLYLACFDLDSGFIIYENKNDQKILTFEVKRDQVFLDKLFKKYEKIWNQYQEGILPDRPAKSKSSDICKYCNLKDFCWSDNEGVIPKVAKVEEPF